MIDLSKHYGALTASERLKLSIEAMARGDWEEATALGETCPKIQYVAQRDLAFTGAYLNLQSIVLVYAVFFNQTCCSIVAAMFTQDTRAYSLRRAELMAQIEAWARFCDYAGFDPETVLLAFGLKLDTDLLNDLPAGEIEPDETMIKEFYQGYLRVWE